MSSVLAGFLVRLGFVVDKDEQAKFQASIDYAGKRMKEIAMRGAALGTAFTAAFAKSTQEVNRFYNLTNQVGGSVRGLNNVASAVAKVGGNYDQAVSSIQAFANKLTFTPGMDQYIKNLTGVDIRDKNGQLREYSDILLDLRKRWKTLGDAAGRNEAAMMGLDGIYADIMKKDFASELQKTNKQQGELADMVDKSADSVHRLSNEFSRTWEIISMGSKAAFGTLSDSLGLDKVAAKVNNKLSKELPAWVRTEKNIWDQSHGFGDYLKNFFFKADEFQDAERYKRHLMDDEQVQAFLRKKYTKQKTVLDDEAEEGVSIVDDFDKKGFEEELARYRAAGSKAPPKPAQTEAPPAPGKMSRGLRNNNPGNIRPVSRNQANDGAFTIYRTPEEGWGALGKQLKAYANAGLDNVASIISKYAPSSENNTGAYIQSVTANMSKRLGSDVGALTRLDLSDPRVLKALMQSITEHENFRGASQYFEGASFDKEVLAAAQSQWRSKVVNERDKIPSQGNVVVNQNITINGADNPRAVGQAVAHETLLAQNRYGQRNLS
nr:MAG TPA: virion protein [Caudoviricetes sp.]